MSMMVSQDAENVLKYQGYYWKVWGSSRIEDYAHIKILVRTQDRSFQLGKITPLCIHRT